MKEQRKMRREEKKRERKMHQEVQERCERSEKIKRGILS